MTARTLSSVSGTSVLTYHNDSAAHGTEPGRDDPPPRHRQRLELRQRSASSRPTGRSTRSRCCCPTSRFLARARTTSSTCVTEHDSVYAFDADVGSGPLAHLDARRWRSPQRWPELLSGHARDRHHRQHLSSTRRVARTRRDLRRGDVEERIGHLHPPSSRAWMSTTGARAVRRAQNGAGVGAAASAPAAYGGTLPFDPKQYEERAGLLLTNGQTHHGVELALRHRSTYGLDHRRTTRNTLAQTASAERHAQRIARRALDGRRGARGRFRRQRLPARRQRHVRHDAERPAAFRAWATSANAFLKDRRPTGGLAVADYFATFDTVSKSNADSDLGIRRHARPARPRRRRRPDQAPRRRRRQGRAHVRRRPRRDGQVERLVATRSIRTSAGRIGGDVFSNAGLASTARCTTARAGCSAQGVQDRQRASCLRLPPSSNVTKRSATLARHPASPASGTANGIVWAVENSNPAVLHAYDALRPVARALQLEPGAIRPRHAFGPGNKFITPTIVNGRVFVGTATGVAVFSRFGLNPPTGLTIRY